MPDTFWFDPDSLRALCEDGPWMRGKALLAQGVVGEPDIEPLDEGWRIQALVQGTQHLPYEVAVTLAVMPDGQVDYWRSVCDCPVGRQCKHAVALMLKAARLPLSDEARAAAAPRKDVSAAAAAQSARERMAAVQQAEPQAQLVNWLAALDRAAVARLTLRNPNPYDGEPYYNLGLVLRRSGHDADAYEALYKSAWNMAWQAPAYHELAKIDALRGDWARALDHLGRSLRFNTDNLAARNLKAVALDRLGLVDESKKVVSETLALDPLDPWARTPS